ncbi:hypothetical protein [Dentiradicibacter hellwigii]|uniref:Uncharacterized protein n=1 Tax=Dentiradicibacter hellwigii TaxID=3149053 RepID=A0ABV4UBA1_9RHOO
MLDRVPVGKALEQFEPVAAERRVAVWQAWFADAGIARRIRTALRFTDE